jgi:hypothetical protein
VGTLYAHPAIESDTVIYINREEFSTESDFYRQCCRAFSNAGFKYRVAGLVDKGLDSAFFASVLKQLKRYRLIFLVDNCRNGDFVLPTVQNIRQDHQLSHVQFVVTCSTEMIIYMVNSHFLLEGLLPLNIPSLSDVEARRFIQELTLNDDIDASDVAESIINRLQWLTPLSFTLIFSCNE